MKKCDCINLQKCGSLVATSSYQPPPQLPNPHFCNLTEIVLLWWTHHCPVYGSICASIAPLEALWLYLGHISVVMFLNCCPKAPKARSKWGVYSAQTPPLTHSKLSVVCQPGKKILLGANLVKTGNKLTCVTYPASADYVHLP